LAFAIGAVPCAMSLPIGAAEFLGGTVSWMVSWANVPADYTGKAALLALAFVVAASGWLLPRKPALGRRVLVGAGVAAVAFIVIRRLHDGSTHAPVWPIVLAGLAFLYLWWLGILMFDLTFVWHRYIRRSVAVETLLQWRHGRDAKQDALMGLWKRDRR
jgi:hypothetical protein